MSQITRTDGLVGNAAIKYPCRMASTANLTLSGLQTIDGVVGAQDDRVLVKDQTTGTENGIYVMDSGTWERAQDADNDGAFTEGSLIKVNNGTVGQGFWYVTNTGTIEIDTTSITFAQASTILATISAFWQTIIVLTTAALSRTGLGLGTGDSPTFTGVTTSAGVSAGTTVAAGTSLTVGTLTDLSAAGAGQVKFPSTQNPSSNANTLDDYAEATFTATLVGCTTSPTYTIRVTKVGNQVIMTLPSASAITGTSNSTGKSLTGMPAAYRPSSTVYIPVTAGQDSGTATTVFWTIGSDGTITMNNGLVAGPWTGSGTFAAYWPSNMGWNTAS